MKNPEYTFLENRALSVLLFGKGFCMDYAAALVLLLRGTKQRESEGYLAPECPQNYPSPARRDYTPQPKQDSQAILAQPDAECRQYEQKYAPLELCEYQARYSPFTTLS